MVKRFVMLQLWRVQQSYTLLSLLLWGILITLTAYPIIEPLWLRFLAERFGIPASTPGAVALALVLIFFGVYAFLYVLGIIYDKYLRLWREQLDVAYERNPYTREKLMVKEILLWKHMFLPSLRTEAKDSPEVQEEIRFMERWIAKSVSMDGNIKRAVREAERWIETETPVPTEGPSSRDVLPQAPGNPRE